MSKDKKTPQPVTLNREIVGCQRWVPGKSKGAGCPLLAGHEGNCPPAAGGAR